VPAGVDAIALGWTSGASDPVRQVIPPIVTKASLVNRQRFSI
jgi:hypothetical protein